jgi:thiosulfate/3-mercaptopyruvate sulfurtransferase
MKMRTLIDATTLNSLLGRSDVLVVDCRFDIADAQRGSRDYAQAHIPGAVYADLDHDLSDLTKRGLGRHPLPDASHFTAALGRWGWTPQTFLVAYDNANGALAAARLWWMLRLIGHEHAAVLDGGFAAWKNAAFALTPEQPQRAATRVDADFDTAQIVYTDELQRLGSSTLLIDARAAPRYRGDVEPIDPVAGHVPGAANRPFSDNLIADGTFKPGAVLREEFSALLGTHEPAQVVHMCGSGVTACHNLLAMEHAGLAGSRVYAPSWSGWIADASRPVARGAS